MPACVPSAEIPEAASVDDPTVVASDPVTEYDAPSVLAGASSDCDVNKPLMEAGLADPPYYRDWESCRGVRFAFQ